MSKQYRADRSWLGRSARSRVALFSAVRSFRLPPPASFRGIHIPRVVWPLVASLVLLAASVIAGSWLEDQHYRLDPAVARLIGPADDRVSNQVRYDEAKQQYVLTAPKSPSAADTASVGTAPHQAPYGVALPTELSKGITVTDPETQLAMTLVPMTRAGGVRLVDGHYVYALTTNRAQAVYTVKGNGLQEDIVLPHGFTKAVSFQYR